MSDFPDPDEEFELMYGDELDLLNEQDDDFYIEPGPKARKSLNFNAPTKTNNITGNTTLEPNFNDNSSVISNQNNASISLESSSKNDSFSEFTLLDPTSAQNSDTLTITEPENNRKRTVTDLFGDINDMLLEDELSNISKKFKQTETEKREQDLALIQEIVELRRFHQEKQNSIIVKRTRNETNYSESNNRDKRNISSSVPKYPFIGVRKHDGDKVYVRFHSEDYEKDETSRILQDFGHKGIMGDSFKETWDKAKILLNKHLDNENTEENDENSPIPKNDEGVQLWVEKYKPKKYLELLSDDSTNRIMLKWMKLWDKVVFKRTSIKSKIQTNNNENFDTNNLSKENNKSKFFKKPELSTKLDEFDRPQHKVALLCGPPGLGKTTLAHMVAKHAGYLPVEINASDDRTTEHFKTALENSCQSRSLSFKDKNGTIVGETRPNCIIFDEIDGAPQSSIDFLIKFINGTPKTNAKTSKKSKPNVLKRPIICICNDPYVPALRSLRQIAFVVNFPKISNARLAERLIEIARRERIKTSMGAMLALAEKSNNDIRSCLSVLNFFKSQKSVVHLSDVLSVSIGQKDVQQGLFSVWNDIFQVPRSQENVVLTNKARMQKVLHTVSSFGDYERLTQGVFENYPKIIKNDADFSNTSEAMDWFIFNDLLSRQIYTLQNYSLSSYLAYAFVVWNFVFGSQHKPKLQYPSAGYEAKQKQTRQKAIISEVLRGMSPSLRCYCQPISLLLDTLPFLTRIITPPFRPVSLHLYTKEEKDALLKVVNIMIDYNLNFVQERSAEGSYVYNLEPNITSLVVFNMDECAIRPLSYSNKQLIAREIEMEKVRRTEKSKPTPKLQNETAVLPNHMQKLRARTVNAKKNVTTQLQQSTVNMVALQIFVLALAITGYNANVVISNLPANLAPEYEFGVLPGNVAAEISHLPGDVAAEISHLPGDVASEISHLPGDVAAEVGHLPADILPEFGHLPAAISPDFGHLPQDVVPEFGHLPGVISPEFGHLPGSISTESEDLPAIEAQPVPKCASYIRSLLVSILAKLPADEQTVADPEHLPEVHVPENDLPSVEAPVFQNPCLACFKHIQLLVERVNSYNSVITTF